MARQQRGVEDRETLLPCPACGGEGKKLVERAAGLYKTVKCRWCQMAGVVDKNTMAMFSRWLRLYNVNRLAGRCPLPKSG